MGEFILSNLERTPEAKPINALLNEKSFKWLGNVIMIPVDNQFTDIDFTSPPGKCTGLFYSLMFQLRKWEFFVEKADEWVEVSPVHQQYYAVTMKQKEELERKIKEGLRSVSEAIADLELLEHDMRKYNEFITYFGLKFENGKLVKDPEKEVNDEALKSIFIDQVDYHVGATGEGPGRLSMSFMRQHNIMPTIVDDFFAMKSEEDLEKDRHLKNLPTVEKNFLRVKFRAYLEWKKMFEEQVKKRFLNIHTLIESRKKSVEEYREWLKPYIARHKLLEEGLSSPGRRKAFRTLFIHTTGQAIAYDGITLWAWREFTAPELQRVPGEIEAKKPIDPLDEWTQKHLVWNKDYGLVASYPWITKEWVENMKKEILTEWLRPHEIYYSFFEISMSRINLKFADGSEFEDADYIINTFLFSKNAMLVKLLELKAKQEEFERYINELLGLPMDFGKKQPITEEKRKGKFSKFLDFLGIGMSFFKRGPYERDFKDRITKMYLKPMASERFNLIVDFIKSKIGYGE